MFSFAFSFVFLSYYVIIINNRGKQMKKYLFFVLGFILICSAIFTLAPAKITSINAINESRGRSLCIPEIINRILPR